MKETKIFRFLALLSKEDIKKFGLFVESPYFNNSAAATTLLKFLLRYAPHFDDPKCTLDAAYAHVYGKKGTLDKKAALAKPLSQLFTLSEEFVLHQHVKNNPLLHQCRLMQFYNDKDFHELTESVYNRAKEEMARTPAATPAYYWLEYNLESDWSLYQSVVQNKKLPEANLSKILRSLEALHALATLRVFCALLAQRSIYKNEFDHTKAAHWVNGLDIGAFGKDTAIMAWYHAWQLLSDPNEDRYQQLKQHLQTETHISHQDQSAMYGYLNDVSRKVFSGRNAHMNALFSNYKEMLGKGILTRNGFLSPAMLRNITVVGLKLGQFEWVQQFLDNNKSSAAQEKDDTRNLCYAYLYFEQKLIDRCLDMLNMLQYDSIFTKMDERRLRLMCYYELGLDLPFRDLVNSFRKFLTTNKDNFAEMHLEANRNFLNFVRRLNDAVFEGAVSEFEAIREEAEAQATLPEREWILSKVFDFIPVEEGF